MKRSANKQRQAAIIIAAAVTLYSLYQMLVEPWVLRTYFTDGMRYLVDPHAALPVALGIVLLIGAHKRARWTPVVAGASAAALILTSAAHWTGWLLQIGTGYAFLLTSLEIVLALGLLMIVFMHEPFTKDWPREHRWTEWSVLILYLVIVLPAVFLGALYWGGIHWARFLIHPFVLLGLAALVARFLPRKYAAGLIYSAGATLVVFLFAAFLRTLGI